MRSVVFLCLLNGVVLVRTSELERTAVEIPEYEVYGDDDRFSFIPEAEVPSTRNDTAEPDEMRSGNGEGSRLHLRFKELENEKEASTSEEWWSNQNEKLGYVFPNSREGRPSPKQPHLLPSRDEPTKPAWLYPPLLPGVNPYKVFDINAFMDRYFAETTLASSEAEKTWAELPARRTRRQLSVPSPPRGARPSSNAQPPPQSGPRRTQKSTDATKSDIAKPIKPITFTKSSHDALFNFEADAEWVPKEHLQQDLIAQNTPTDPLFRVFSRQTVKDDDRPRFGRQSTDLEITELPDFGQETLVVNLYDRPDLHQMRQAGPLCGMFIHPMFHAELRAVNESAYVLRNIYVNTRARFSSLTVTYMEPDNSTSEVIAIGAHQRLRLHNFQFVLNSRIYLRNLLKVKIMDNLRRFSAHVNVSDCIVPRTFQAPGLLEPKNGVLSRYITLYTSNVLVIGNFTYPGSCPSAYFWAGRSNNPSNGFQIPNPDGSRDPLRIYTNEDVWLQLPNGFTFYDLDYVGVFCPSPRQMLGYIYLRRSDWANQILPPAILSEERLRIKHASSIPE